MAHASGPRGRDCRAIWRTLWAHLPYLPARLGKIFAKRTLGDLTMGRIDVLSLADFSSTVHHPGTNCVDLSSSDHAGTDASRRLRLDCPVPRRTVPARAQPQSSGHVRLTRQVPCHMAHPMGTPTLRKLQQNCTKLQQNWNNIPLARIPFSV